MFLKQYKRMDCKMHTITWDGVFPTSLSAPEANNRKFPYTDKYSYDFRFKDVHNLNQKRHPFIIISSNNTSFVHHSSVVYSFTDKIKIIGEAFKKYNPVDYDESFSQAYYRWLDHMNNYQLSYIIPVPSENQFDDRTEVNKRVITSTLPEVDKTGIIKCFVCHEYPIVDENIRWTVAILHNRQFWKGDCHKNCVINKIEKHVSKHVSKTMCIIIDIMPINGKSVHSLSSSIKFIEGGFIFKDKKDLISSRIVKYENISGFHLKGLEI